MGKVISGGELADWVAVGRDLDCTLLIDEFYSHYVWSFGEGEPGPMVSAARYVEDVDRDPVVIVDGLTKNWRYPGWRVTWTLGPRPVIETIESAGSFLDGGGSRPQQRAAVALMEPEKVLAEARAIRETFLPKRELMLRRAHEMGMRIYPEPAGTFYAFVSVRDLPEPLSDGMGFFRAALDRKVISRPGPLLRRQSRPPPLPAPVALPPARPPVVRPLAGRGAAGLGQPGGDDPGRRGGSTLSSPPDTKSVFSDLSTPRSIKLDFRDSPA